MDFNITYKAAMAAMRKRAAAVLTPEAEQAAMQDPSMGAQGGMPADPMAMQGDPMQGAPAPAEGATGPNGGMIPPEIVQDQQFLQWLQSQGITFDPQSGQFLGPDGQPVPADIIMQAYQQYQAELQGQAPQGADPNAGAMPPMDPAAAQGAMPPAEDPAAMAGGMPPADPSMMQDPNAGAMAPAAPAQGGGLPPEILQDQAFMSFIQDPQNGLGIPFDPNSGAFVDPQTGQPIPDDMIMQAYQVFQQQQGGAPAEGAAPEGQAPEAAAAAGMPPEMLDQFQSMIDAAIQNFTAQLDKKLETLMDKLDTVKMALESQRDTEDKRAKQDKDDAAALRDEIAAELNPTGTVKEASAQKPKAQAKRASAVKPINMFDLLMGK